MKTPLMNIIGNRRAVNEILAVGISLAATATNIPRAEKVKASTILGALIGTRARRLFGEKVGIIGGIVLVMIGVRILASHLF